MNFEVILTETVSLTDSVYIVVSNIVDLQSP